MGKLSQEQVIKKIAEVATLVDGGPIAIAEYILNVEDQISQSTALLNTQIAGLNDVISYLQKNPAKEVTIAGLSTITLRGKDGLPGEPGKNGESYILTDSDKQEIATIASAKIQPIEKVIEKHFETVIRETPIVTENVVQVAKYQTSAQIRDSLETLEGDDRLDAKYIKGLESLDYINQATLDRAISILDQRTSFLINKVSALAARPSTGGSGVPAGVNGDVQLNIGGAFGILAGTHLDTTGNPRGAQAIDFQSARGAVTQVASGANSVALGSSNTASGGFSIAIGSSNTASGDNGSIAFGNNNLASQSQAQAIGKNNTASGSDSIAYGIFNSATGSSSTAFGTLNTSSGQHSLAVGEGNQALGDYSGALGYNTITNHALSFALGSGISSEYDSSVILGAQEDAKLTLSSAGVVKMTGITNPANYAVGNFYSLGQSITTVENTSTRTSMLGAGVGTRDLPANFFNWNGKTVRIVAKGMVKCNGGTTLNIRLEINGVEYLAIGNITCYATPDGSTAYSPFTIEIYIASYGAGTDTVVCTGDMRYAMDVKGGVVVGLVGTAPASLTFNQTNTLGLTAEWGGSSPDFSIITQTCTMEVLPTTIAP